jgi:cullin-4
VAVDYDPEFGMGEEMFKDLALSKESVREYDSKLDEDSPGQKLNAMVLQRSAWPFTVQKHSIDLPPNVRLIPLFLGLLLTSYVT